MSARRTDHTFVGGVPVATAGEAAMTAMLAEDCRRLREGKLARAVTVMDCNGQTISMYATNPEFSAALDAASLVHADGQFVVWASHLAAGPPVPERTATTDFIHAASRQAAQDRLRFYLLGGSEEINRGCAERLAAAYPGLEIAGRRHGYFSAGDEPDIVADINASGADVVWVGLGKPKEQIFVHRHAKNMACAWVVTCGGCFNFVTEAYSRAPVWMQRLGFEWLHRMITGPRYLLLRYAFTIPHSILIVFFRDIIRIGKNREPAHRVSER